MMIKENRLWGSALCFVLVFFSIYGNKISYLDFSIIVPFLVLSFCIAIRQSINFNRNLLLIAGLIAFLLAYQVAMQLLHSTFDINSLLRLTRSVLVCIMFSALVSSDIFTSKQIVDSLFYSLLAHAILIDAAAMFDPLNYLLASISENDRVRPMRASGLLAGFDIAGLLCLLGLLMLLLGVAKPRFNWLIVTYVLIFLLGCFFTSRVSIALSILFLSVLGANKLLKSNLHALSKIVIALMLTAIGFYLIREYVAPIVEVTFSLGLLDVDSEQRDFITSRNAVQSTDSFLWSRMFYLPDGYLNTIFGTGIEDLDSDVGYVKDIFRYGIIGMLLSSAIYIYALYVGKRGLLNGVKRPLNSLLMILFLLIWVLTLKNNYFFTRAIFPATLLLVSASIISRRESSLRKTV